MSSNTVIVTGGAGYVGSHACRLLAERGYKPIVVDSLERGHRDFVKWGPLEEINILDTEALSKTIAKHNPSAVMHFAAYALVAESVKEPEKYMQNNLGGLKSLIAAMKESQVSDLIFSSTCAVYGEPDGKLLHEDFERNPIQPYGESKKLCEDLLVESKEDINFVSLRYFNACGAAEQGTGIGERHEPETHLIPNVLIAIANNNPVKMFGSDYPTSDGTCVRDYVHVDDLASAHVLALEKLSRERVCDFFNLGIGKGYSVKEVIEECFRVTGKKVPVEIKPRRDGDPASLVANGAKAREALGWDPSHSTLENIVSSAWSWHRSELGLI